MPQSFRLTRFVSAGVEFLSRRKMIVDLNLRNSYSLPSPSLELIFQKCIAPAVPLKLPGAGGCWTCL